MTMFTALGAPAMAAVTPLAGVALMIAAAIASVTLLVAARARLQRSLKRLPVAAPKRHRRR